MTGKLLTTAPAVLLAGILSAGAQTTITQFANDFFPPAVSPTWSLTPVDSSTSLLTGTNSNGNSIAAGFDPQPTSLAGTTQISITGGNATFIPGSSFLFTLEDVSGNTVSAVFSWDQLGVSPSVSPLTPLGPFDMTQVIGWEMLSVYGGGPPGLINLQLSSASAVSAPLPAAGVSGPLIAGTGAIALTNGVGDFTGGSTAVQNLSSATQVSLTASATISGAPPGTPFTYVLTDHTGAQAYAAFNWANFTNGTQTVTSQLMPDGFFDASSVVSWQIVSGSPNAVTANILGAGAFSTNPVTVVDSFTVATPNLTNTPGPNLASSTISLAGFTNATRSVQTEVSGSPPANSTVELGGGSMTIAAVEPGSGASLLYNDFTLYAPNQTWLRLDFAASAGLDLLLVEVLSTTGSTPAIGGSFMVADNNDPFTFDIDLTTLPGFTPEFMAGIDQLTLAFSTTQNAMVMELDEISFSQVPEPSTVVLALAGLAAAVVAARRREGRGG